ncbi:hypothetical protein SBD_4355 [Streptomyces bottropensis ATCC 25435]|uniref:Uncharacterized protein n=1 Tax=Streptomyces bottropensis ATCC 25435 TaxID=1054862 RepID=M3EZR4_9ACTN|nr:hypothetical protein SBD_4355 [Streptomyces bottropensis ATCC 25435]
MYAGTAGFDAGAAAGAGACSAFGVCEAVPAFARLRAAEVCSGSGDD